MPSFLLENQHGREAGRIICGVDEAGRGPLAGPVVAAAMVVPENFPKKIAARINDSKKLTHETREELFPQLVEHGYGAVAQASVEEIETLNILQATLLAMARAVENLRGVAHASCLLAYSGTPLALDGALVDGNRPPKLSCPVHCCVEGDAKSLSIAAASILAKVMRDRLMLQLHDEFPHYGFANHMGYGTPEHLQALRTHGPCRHHRKSFRPVRESYFHYQESQVA